MFSFARDAWELVHGRAPTLFMAFFSYVWVLWTVKALAARRYRPCTRRPSRWRTSLRRPHGYRCRQADFR